MRLTPFLKNKIWKITGKYRNFCSLCFEIVRKGYVFILSMALNLYYTILIIYYSRLFRTNQIEGINLLICLILVFSNAYLYYYI